MSINRYLHFKAFLLLLLVFIFGCSPLGEESNSYQTVKKNFISSNDWDINAELNWNKRKVVGKIEAIYKGKAPLEYVVIEPDFSGGSWPEGYIYPNAGVYTWKAENKEGAIPGKQETSSMSNAILSKEPKTIMNISEAKIIVNCVKFRIKWKEANNPKVFEITNSIPVKNNAN
ncbi:hypothetical protein [Desulfotruncus alcoholivorax]|uniref:hypothetical protein n=1 Tax=Desulfotruncus alcoholivorax TaxID=265477 RepID=UPI00048662A0|nr:hypothetical protein [Desulfotruncus alcoholivorax]